ncbi:MAG TPA: DUF6567 family protein [Geobacteraceae bacterium]
MKKCLYLIGTASLFLMTGCASVGNMQHSTDTQVVLKGNNYKIIKAGVKGASSGFWLLGLIPIVSPNYADAKANLYENIGKSLEGKSVALANQTQDRSFLYLILFSIPKVTITADVVEFIDQPAIPQENKAVKE